MENADQNIKSDPGAPPKLKKADFAAMAGILLLGTLFIILQRFMEPQMGRDSVYYLSLVDCWKTGGFQGAVSRLGVFWFPPLHLSLIVLLSNLGLSSENAAMVISMGCGILLPVVSFAIAREIFHDRRISLAAALLTAVNPSIIEMSVQAQRDIPYLLTVGWCIYFITVAIRRPQWYWWCCAGGCFGVSMLLRYETAELVPLLGIYFLVVLFKKQQKWYLLIRNLIHFAICGAAVMTILLYVTGTLHYMTGSYYRYFNTRVRCLQELYNGGQKK